MPRMTAETASRAVAPLGRPGDRASIGGLSIGIVGAGRVGAVLGAALRRAGHPVVAVSARSVASQARAAELLPGVPLVSPVEVARRSAGLLLAVSDDAVAQVVRDLVAAGAIGSGQLVAHVSGRHGLAVLQPAAEVGAATLALHPAMTFSGTAADLDRLAGASFGVTALGRYWSIAEQLVSDVGGHAVAVPEELRPLWHAGLAHGANHLVTLVASALDVVRATGVADPAAVLRPLLSAALDNALVAGDAALTGPVARGDADTVAAHLDVLAAEVPQERPTYLALARATAGRLPDPHPELLDVLAEVPRSSAPDSM
jgi:predicted short-subunit dehydrogenase-like oxidoreductase (DUF2520 family)